VNNSGVNHDALSGYQASQHRDWSLSLPSVEIHQDNIPDLSAFYEGAGAIAAHESAFDHGSMITLADVTFSALNATGGVGTGAEQVALGNHDHAGVYEPVDPAILRSGSIGTSVAAHVHEHAGVYEPADASILKVSHIGSMVASQTHNHDNDYEQKDGSILRLADIGSSVQGYDENLASRTQDASWSGAQLFLSIQHGYSYYAESGLSRTIPLDGGFHFIVLTPGIDMAIGFEAVGQSYCFARLRIRGNTSFVLSFLQTGEYHFVGTRVLKSLTPNLDNGKYNDYLIEGIAGGNITAIGLAAEP
jgi:hypothetical protein